MCILKKVTFLVVLSVFFVYPSCFCAENGRTPTPKLVERLHSENVVDAVIVVDELYERFDIPDNKKVIAGLDGVLKFQVEHERPMRPGPGPYTLASIKRDRFTLCLGKLRSQEAGELLAKLIDLILEHLKDEEVWRTSLRSIYASNLGHLVKMHYHNKLVMEKAEEYKMFFGEAKWPALEDAKNADKLLEQLKERISATDQLKVKDETILQKEAEEIRKLIDRVPRDGWDIINWWKLSTVQKQILTLVVLEEMEGDGFVPMKMVANALKFWESREGEEIIDSAILHLAEYSTKEVRYLLRTYSPEDMKESLEKIFEKRHPKGSVIKP